MEQQNFSDKKHITVGIIIGIILLTLTAGIYAMAMLMVSVMVIGCVKSPPEWVYTIVFLGFPIPLIITSIVDSYLYIKRQRVIWIIFTPIIGLFLSCVIFLIWFIILTQYC